MRLRSYSACLSTVAVSSRSRRWISASCTLTSCSFSTWWMVTSSARTCCCMMLPWISYALSAVRLLLLHHLQVFGLLHFEIALRFGLLGLRERLGQHALLVGLRLGDGGFARGHGAPDGGIAIGFGGGHVGVALDARHVGPAHVGDVLVLVADFLDGEGNDFQPHLVHVVGAGGAHAVAHHFRLLDDLFHRELADDAAQVAFHHQADQAFALLGRLGEKLLGRGENRLGIGLHLDLRHGFHRDRDALAGVEVLLRRDVERHQLERQPTARSPPWGRSRCRGP